MQQDGHTSVQCNLSSSASAVLFTKSPDESQAVKRALKSSSEWLGSSLRKYWNVKCMPAWPKVRTQAVYEWIAFTWKRIVFCFSISSHTFPSCLQMKCFIRISCYLFSCVVPRVEKATDDRARTDPEPRCPPPPTYMDSAAATDAGHAAWTWVTPYWTVDVLLSRPEQPRESEFLQQSHGCSDGASLDPATAQLHCVTSNSQLTFTRSYELLPFESRDACWSHPHPTCT